MRITHITIHNYRSISHIDIKCEPMMVFIGPNNSGKSNVIHAIEFCLSTSAKPREEDFFAFRSEDKDIWVEMTFNDLTEQEKNTFKRYLKKDNSICIRKTAVLSNSNVDIRYNGWIQQPSEWWLQRDGISRLSTREDVEKTPLKELVPTKGKISKAALESAQESYIEQHKDSLTFTKSLETSTLLGPKNIGGGVLPDFYLVPAIRDLSDETKIKTTTVFGRLLTRAVQEMAERDQRYIDIREKLDNLINAFNVTGDTVSEDRPEQLKMLEKNLENELQGWGVSVSIEIKPPDLEKIFELGTSLFLNDGYSTLAEAKGHGLQRAVIFGLLRAWAKVLRDVKPDEEERPKPRKASDSVVFAIEEPELFLHPHAQRRMSEALQQIACTNEHQVFVSTHSTHFVDLDNYKSLCIVIKHNAQEGTVPHQNTEELFTGEDISERKKRFHMAQWINPDRGEMFFAMRVVFVEGETEKITIPYLGHKLGYYDPDISIIDCGSKNNLPLYINIANAFKIPYIVVHDEDPLPNLIPDDWSDDKVKSKKGCFNLNKEIKDLIDSEIGIQEILCPDFEGVSNISKTQTEKKGKPLAALDHFSEMNPDEIPTIIKDLVNKVYAHEG